VSAERDLQDEWARANRAGRTTNRRKAVATIASIAVTAPIVVAGYVALYALWPSNRIPVLFLALPWLPALPAGLWVRGRLWPRGALGR
jgi:hypothetical protein